MTTMMMMMTTTMMMTTMIHVINMYSNVYVEQARTSRDCGGVAGRVNTNEHV